MEVASLPTVVRETRDRWNETSEYFQAEGEIPVGVHYGPGCPDDDGLGLGLLPAVEGADVVELGCGGAQCGVALARRGGARVVGVDLSTAQLSYAADLVADHDADVRLVEGDVTALPLAGDGFDLAFSAYAFQWVPDLQACFAEAARVLRDGGAFVFSLPHPFYQRFDPETGDLARSYFETGAERTSHEGIDADEVLFHRIVGDVHRGLVDAGFRVERLFEPGADDPDAYEELWNSKPELMAMVPRTLVVRAVLDVDG
jgi:ubiquinone/menaquinone biosynthesis C-methylase UbiE